MLTPLLQTSGSITTAQAMTINMGNIDNLLIVFCTFLVFMMHLGFALLESGLTRSKNTTNVLYKNALAPAIALIAFAVCGYGIMFPNFPTGSSGFFGFAGMGVPEGIVTNNLTGWTHFLFQAMFAATGATIVSGAVAERIKLNAYIIFTTLFLTLFYPMIASWTWGGGWLDVLEFHDFAGSTIVHSVGGAAALAGVATLGTRLGKFNGKIILPLPGHNMTSATTGAILLWLGWIGFNGGSLLTMDSIKTPHVIVITLVAGAAGAIAAHFMIVLVSKKYDLSMLLNGILAGLVSVTAAADQVSLIEAIIIGFVGGVIVVPSIYMFESLKLDDPVGALSVHLVCGFWGTLAVGIFGDLAGISQLVVQLTGAIVCILTSFICSLIVFSLIKATMGIRVTKEQELTGLDLTEHGMKAYTFVSK